MLEIYEIPKIRFFLSWITYTEFKKRKLTSLLKANGKKYGTHSQKINFMKTNQASDMKATKRGKNGILLIKVRIGHARITHVHLLRSEVIPRCVHCNHRLTDKHILVNVKYTSLNVVNITLSQLCLKILPFAFYFALI